MSSTGALLLLLQAICWVKFQMEFLKEDKSSLPFSHNFQLPIIKKHREKQHKLKMKSSFSLFLGIITLGFAAPFGSAQNLRASNESHQRRGLRQLTESCVGLIAEVQFENDTNSNGVGVGGPPREDTFLSCQTDDGMLYKVRAAGKPFIENDFRKGGFKSGETELLFDSDAVVDEATAEILSRSPPGLRKKEENASNNRRELYATTTGDVSVLVVRVIANGGTTGFSEDFLSNSVFGNGAGGLTVDPVTLRSQYAACSHNKLNFVEAPSRTGSGGPDIANGATTVTVGTTVSTGNDGAMVNAITTQLRSQFGVTSERNLAKHLMYCLPAGTMNGIAYAWINSAISVYSNEWCNYVSAQMHELGHNLNMAHSNEAGTYKDQSGMMGYSYSNSNTKMCFNGAKSWQFGWYSNRHVAMDSISNRIYSGKLMSILDNPDVAGDPMLIKIDNGSNDYFIHFNRMAGFNSGTREGGNQIMITRAGNGNNYVESELLSKLSAGGTYSMTANGETVVVTVNLINTSIGNGYADISVCFGSCDTPAPTTAVPTKAPSASPTAPTPAPTRSPTKAPTPLPTPAPTAARTSSPTKAPTPFPTPAPIAACSSLSNKSLCNNRADCIWQGNPNSGSCLSNSGPGPSPTPPSPTPPSPTPPSPTPPSPTPPGNCSSYTNKFDCQSNGCSYSNKFKTCSP